MRNLLTPQVIACEIAMLLNRERPGIFQDAEVTVDFPYDVKTDSTALQAILKGVVVEIEDFRTRDLTMEIDPFSERFVQPLVAAFLNEFDRVAITSFDVRGAARN